MDPEPKERMKPGRVPGPITKKATVLLPPDLMEWGKNEPGGLSETIRIALRDLKAKRSPRQKP